MSEREMNERELPTDVLVGWLREHAARESSVWLSLCADRMESLTRELDEARRHERALQWLAQGPHSLLAYQTETGVRWQVPDWCTDRDPLSAIEAAMGDVYYEGPLLGASAPTPPEARR